MMNSEASSSNAIESVENDEFTLQDTYDHLREDQREKQSEIDELTEIIKNNEVHTMTRNTRVEDIIRKQQQLLESLEKLVLEEDPKYYPLPKTNDLYMTAIQGLEDEILNMNAILDGMEKELSSLKSDVTYLEDKKSGLEKMKEAALNVAEDDAKKTYEEEFALAKRLFNKVKGELSSVVNLVFPENNELNNFLVELSKAQLKGGDDVYVKIHQRNVLYANYLETTGIIVLHPNDKHMCKMVNLL